ncbi:fimbrial protein [Pseudomonas putida]|uniref:fimbrial protein n=1 Tax=Pseudomonas putida TaxID=303 RepID=UPI002366A5D4|nr:fimbrial protein [Pseudomonas putida]MDD2047057.1 type 1 fimbrial protein [Pseudomonas putida]
MKKILMGLGVLSALLLPGSVVIADEIRLNFSGNLIVPTCELTVDNPEQTVKFDDYSKKDLMATGKSPAMPFYITVKTCASASKVNIIFKGMEDALVSGALAVSGAASGIAVGLETSADERIKLNRDTLSFNLSGGVEDRLSFKAYVLKQPNSTVEAGSFSAVANFELSYP